MTKFKIQLRCVLGQIQSGESYGQHTAGIAMAAGMLLLNETLEEILKEIKEKNDE
jgi:hypothetical protein